MAHQNFFQYLIIGILIHVFATNICHAATNPQEMLKNCQINKPYGKMRALLQRTIFRIDVLSIDVCVDDVTQSRLKSVLQNYSDRDKLHQNVTDVIMQAPSVLVLLQLKRDVPTEKFVEALRDNLKKAFDAGMISLPSYQSVWENLPLSFGRLQDRGFKKGDLLVYEVEKNALRTRLTTVDGFDILNRVDPGLETRKALLAGSLAPGSVLRKPLIESLFENRDKATT